MQPVNKLSGTPVKLVEIIFFKALINKTIHFLLQNFIQNLEAKFIFCRFISEIELLKKVQFETIVNVKGYTNYNSSVAMIMEYLPGGTLFQLLLTKLDKSYKITPKMKLRFCDDISSGITYLHYGFKEKRMVHGDLNPSNILLTFDLRCKIGGFGSVEFPTLTKTAMISTQPSGERTRWCAAPERLSDTYAPLKRSMDVYSYGVIVYFILERSYPLWKIDDFNDALKETNRKYSAADDFIEKLLSEQMINCCKMNRDERPQMTDLKFKFQRFSRSQNVADITREVAEIQEKLKIKIPFLRDSDATTLANLPDNFF